MADKTALVLLAEGAEEIEAVISIDVLRRAKIKVTVGGLDGDLVECSRGVNIKPDADLLDVKNILYDAVILPGGLKGANKLATSADVNEVLQRHDKAGKLIAAICAAPTALQAHDIAKGRRITSYPSFMNQLVQDYNYSEERTVLDGNILTSRGPGTAFEFALEIVKYLVNAEASKKLADGMLVV